MKLTNLDMEDDWLKPQGCGQSLKMILIGWAEQTGPMEDTGRAAHSPAQFSEPRAYREEQPSQAQYEMPVHWSGLRVDLARLRRPVIQPTTHLGVASKVSGRCSQHPQLVGFKYKR